LQRISKLAAEKLVIAEEHFDPYGHYKAKVSLDYADSLKGSRHQRRFLCQFSDEFSQFISALKKFSGNVCECDAEVVRNDCFQERVGGEFAIKRSPGSEIGRGSAVASCVFRRS
jgi:hypothetical protein